MGRSGGKTRSTLTPSRSRIAPPKPHLENIESIILKLKKMDPVLPGELERIYPIKKDRPAINTLKKGQIIGVCGSPQAGKDVIAEYIESNYGNVARANFSDYILVEVNQYLKARGLDHEITLANKNEPLYRQLLQEWGGGRFKEDPDYWPRMVEAEVKKLAAEHDLVIVTGLRSPADFEVVEKALGGDVWRAERPGNSYKADHEIEKLAATIPVDLEILNPAEGDLTPFEKNIEAALDSYQKN